MGNQSFENRNLNEILVSSLENLIELCEVIKKHNERDGLSSDCISLCIEEMQSAHYYADKGVVEPD